MKYLLSGFFSLFALFVNAQEKQLSIKEYEALQDKLRILTATNIDSAFIIANEIEASKNNIHKAFSNGAKSFLYQINGDSINSVKSFEIAINLINQLPNSPQKIKTKAYILNYGGICDMQRGNLNEALLKLLEGEKLSKSVNDIIQAVKFNTNIALINGEINNYKTAISKAKYSDYLVEKNKTLYTTEQYKLNKSNIYLSLGKYYEYSYKKDYDKNTVYLDSATFYYNKAILYSKNIITNKIKAQNNLANVYYHRENYKEAEKNYQNVLTEAYENNLLFDYATGLYNLGNFYYWDKKHEKSLAYFKKYDSIFNKQEIDRNNFINSNYYQSKIYETLGDYDNSLKHVAIYLDNFEKYEFKINNEAEKINLLQNNLVLKQEIVSLQKKYNQRLWLKRLSYVFLGLILLFLILLVFKNSIEKRKNKQKFDVIIDTYKKQIKQKEDLIINTSKKLDEFKQEEVNSSNISLNIDEQKENEILDSLKRIEEKLVFLNKDFTQQFVAKKIKTNTTYLSYVVNKNFGKSFSEYANELKINYVINEMISNSKYRKYSTQAIAESVGYKNATSFTRSFSKKTGLSPVQFAKKLDDNNIN